jgi:ABC-type antimicrobial peptide transport system permease subunit
VNPQNPEEKITEGKKRTIESALSEDIEVVVIPKVKPIIVNLDGQEITLMPSITADSRARELLRDGVWLNTQRGRFEIMLPAPSSKNAATAKARTRAGNNVSAKGDSALKANKNLQQLPRTVRTIVGQDSVEFKIVGTVKDKVGYIDYVLLYRLQQLLKNEATYSLKLNAFDVNAKSPYEDRFLIARVHVRNIDDIIEVVKYFEDKQYEIYASNKFQVERLKTTNKILKNLMLLVGLTGGIAGITSLFVLMYEAIKRKRNEIGIMRAMGLSKAFITQIFLHQSLFYGAGGFAIAFILFKILTFLLDNAVGHAVLSLGGLKGSIFIMSIYLIVGFIFMVVLISLIAGRSAAQSARNVDPADILSGN